MNKTDKYISNIFQIHQQKNQHTCTYKYMLKGLYIMNNSKNTFINNPNKAYMYMYLYFEGFYT